jgi:hypothetical protein
MYVHSERNSHHRKVTGIDTTLDGIGRWSPRGRSVSHPWVTYEAAAVVIGGTAVVAPELVPLELEFAF